MYGGRTIRLRNSNRAKLEKPSVMFAKLCFLFLVTTEIQARAF